METLSEGCICWSQTYTIAGMVLQREAVAVTAYLVQLTLFQKTPTDQTVILLYTCTCLPFASPVFPLQLLKAASGDLVQQEKLGAQQFESFRGIGTT